MKLENLKISKRLTIGLGLIFLFVLLLGTIYLINMNILWENVEGLHNHPLITQKAIGTIQTDILNISLEMKVLVLENNEQKIQERLIAIDKYQTEAYQQLDILYNSYLGPRLDIDRIFNLVVQYKPIRDETIQLVKAGNIDEATRQVGFNGIGGVHVQKIIIEVEKISIFAKNEEQQFYMVTQQQKIQNTIQLEVFTGIMFLIIVGMGIFLWKGIIPPLAELVGVTEAFQQKNLEARSKYESSNELGRLASAFNAMAETIQREIQYKEKQTSLLITANEQAEAANESLRRAERYYHSLLEASLDPLIVLGPGGILTDVNSAMEKTTGLIREKLIGTDYSGYFTEPEKAREGYADAFKDGKIVDYALEFKHINGDITPVLFNASLYKDEDGMTMGIFAAARDITTTRKFENELMYLKDNLELLAEKRAAELIIANKELAFQSEQKADRAAELLIANKELRYQNKEKEKRAAELLIANQELATREAEIKELNSQLEYRVLERTAQLEAVNNELESLTYSISHDLKAPLRHITGYISLLVKKYIDLLPDEGHHYLDNISFAAGNMGELIDGLLQFSRTGRIDLKRSSVNMNEIVSELVLPIKEQDSEHRIELEIDSMPSTYGDLDMITSVWSNLIENAVKFTGKKELAKISIGSEENEDEVIYHIKDNGAGFDMNYSSKLFTVFQRLHSREEYEGTGIGLATVQRIITRHGGKIWAESSVGEGTTFYFSLIKRKESEIIWK